MGRVTNPKAVIIVRPATIQDMDHVGEILAQGFSNKFGIAFGRQVDHAPRVLAQIEQLKLERKISALFIAEANERPVGVIELADQPEQSSDSRQQLRIMWREIGILYTLRAAIGLLLLYEENPGDEDTVYICQIAVDAAFRGCGIGRKLLKQAEQWTLARGKQNLALHVAANNRACRLYERFGFRLKNKSEEWLTGRLFGIRTWLYMVKNVRTPTKLD